MKRTLPLLVFWLVSVLTTAAAPSGEIPAGFRVRSLSPEARISLLTCQPGGDAIWRKWGHTALRVQDEEIGLDLCFNYGVFNFDSPHFVWRFILGRNDYILAKQPTLKFIEDYEYQHRWVKQQELNLTEDEKQALYRSLMFNALTENRAYRYNFFYDNCATRARVQVERHIQGCLAYDSTQVFPDFRRSLAHYLDDAPWAHFGIDLLISAPADRPASFTELLYAPEEMYRAFAGGHITDEDGTVRPLVAAETYLLPPGPATSSQTRFPSPTLIFWGLALLVALATFLELKTRRAVWLDALILGTYGLAGLVLFFLAFLSEHPAVSPNYLLLVFHPVHLMYVLALPWKAFRQGWADRYYRLFHVGAALFFALGWWFLPQCFPAAVFPLVLILLLRCVPAARSIHPARS